MLLLWFGVRQITSIGNVSIKSSSATFPLSQARRLRGLADDNVPDAVKENLPKAVKDQMERPVSLLAKELQIERVEDEAHDSIPQLYWDILGVPGS